MSCLAQFGTKPGVILWPYPSVFQIPVRISGGLQGGGLHSCYWSLILCLCWKAEENTLSVWPVKAHRQIPAALFKKWGPLKELLDVGRVPTPTNFFPSCCEAQLSALPVFLRPWLLGNREKLKLVIKWRAFYMPGPMLTILHPFFNLSIMIILQNSYSNSSYFTTEENQALREKITFTPLGSKRGGGNLLCPFRLLATTLPYCAVKGRNREPFWDKESDFKIMCLLCISHS